MKFYGRTQNWLKGEQIEGSGIPISGIVISPLFWKFGSTPNARVLTIPIMIVGMLLTLGMESRMFSNQKVLSGTPQRV